MTWKIQIIADQGLWSQVKFHCVGYRVTNMHSDTVTLNIL